MRFRQIVGAVTAAVLLLSASALSSGAAIASPQRGPLNCVQYVRQATDFQISGNAWSWWDGAKGRYGTSQRPRPGAVLVFKRTASMPYGHVAVVADVIDKRTIRIEHANWAPAGGRKGRVSTELVKDVSDANDWTTVRVEWKPSGSFGKPYPTNGFILPEGRTAPSPRTGVVRVADVPIPAVKPTQQAASRSTAVARVEAASRQVAQVSSVRPTSAAE